MISALFSVLLVLTPSGCDLCGHGPVLAMFCSDDDLGLNDYGTPRYGKFADGCKRRGGEPSVEYRVVAGERRLGWQCIVNGLREWKTP